MVDGRWVPNWEERRLHREEFGSREHRSRTVERMSDGTPLISGDISVELKAATSQISRLGRQRKWEEALAVFASISEPDAVLQSAAVDACARALQLDVAQRLFSEMPVKNLGAYTSLINMFGRLRRVAEAEDLMRNMQQDCIQPDGFVYTSIVMAYGTSGNVDSAMRMFRQRQSLFPPSKIAFGAAMSACGRNGMLHETLALLAEMEAADLQPDVEHLTSVITACARKRDEASGREAFADLRRRGLRPDAVVFSALIGCLKGDGASAKAEALLAEMEQEGIPADSFVFDAMLEVSLSGMEVERFHGLVADMERRGLRQTGATQRKIRIMGEQQSRYQARQALPQVPGQTVPLPPGWHATLDPSTGVHYYWNEKDPSNSVTWQRPAL